MKGRLKAELERRLAHWTRKKKEAETQLLNEHQIMDVKAVRNVKAYIKSLAKECAVLQRRIGMCK